MLKGKVLIGLLLLLGLLLVPGVVSAQGGPLTPPLPKPDSLEEGQCLIVKFLDGREGVIWGYGWNKWQGQVSKCDWYIDLDVYPNGSSLEVRQGGQQVWMSAWSLLEVADRSVCRVFVERPAPRELSTGWKPLEGERVWMETTMPGSSAVGPDPASASGEARVVGLGVAPAESGGEGLMTPNSTLREGGLNTTMSLVGGLPFRNILTAVVVVVAGWLLYDHYWRQRRK